MLGYVNYEDMPENGVIKLAKEITRNHRLEYQLGE
jgi:hypothetical protein